MAAITAALGRVTDLKKSKGETVIIWLASYPRSGNTMVRILLDQGFGISSQEIYYREDRGQSTISRFMGWTPLADWTQLRDGPEPHFLKTHELPSDEAPAIYVVRDGRDAVVSYAHYLQRYQPDSVAGLTFPQVLERVILGRVASGSWSRHVDAWHSRPLRARTAILRYEEIVARPYDCLSAALAALEIAAGQTGKAPMDFADFHQRWPDFFRKGKSGAWREEMSPALERLFWERHLAVMERLGYSQNESATAAA